MNPNEALANIVSKGIVIDIFEAEEALAMEEMISENAISINEATLGAFFASIQRYLVYQAVLSVSKIFDRNKRYSLRSIPAALKLMSEKSEELKITERPELIAELKKLGYAKDTLESLSESDLTQKFVDHFEKLIPEALENSEIKLEVAFHALKTFRDKKVAHHEAVEWDNLPKPNYEQLREFTESAKTFVSMIGKFYLSVVYQCNEGNYSLSSDAMRSSLCLKQILKKLGILDAMTEGYLEQRGHKGNRSQFKKALSKVADVEPKEQDRL